jgi:hypothetical protein
MTLSRTRILGVCNLFQELVGVLNQNAETSSQQRLSIRSGKFIRLVNLVLIRAVSFQTPLGDHQDVCVRDWYLPVAVITLLGMDSEYALSDVKQRDVH